MEDKINDLEKRMQRQEELHQDATFTTHGFIKGLVYNAPLIAAIVTLSVLTTLVIIKNK